MECRLGSAGNKQEAIVQNPKNPKILIPKQPK